MSHQYYPDWKEQIVYGKDGPQPAVLVEDSRLKAILVGLEPGAQIPPHPAGMGVFYFIEGTGWMTVDGEQMRVGPGATVVTGHGAERSIQAETRLAFIATRVQG